MRRWLQALDARGWALLAAAAFAVVVVGVVLVVALTRGGDEPADGGFAVDPARVAELEAAEAARDAENLTASIEHARTLQGELVPVMHALHAVLPVDGTTATPPTAEEVATWRDTLDGLVADTEALASGSSEHNIVRNGMLTSLELLGDAVDAVDLARAADASTAPDLYALAGELRTRAVDTWGLAAIQLDLRATSGGQGHVHVFLPVHPDDALDGGLDAHLDEPPGEHSDEQSGEEHAPGDGHDH
ncbi:hypothetical protein [Cellulosimicrobium cellulans]|uniref:hypothetical protein n=1 Tax=Cellulosimicrobium cellulans TaxID=1710 RepID=UPI001495D198|nr:hypothetical protein [Cellulosimicrobium cellulans]